MRAHFGDRDRQRVITKIPGDEKEDAGYQRHRSRDHGGDGYRNVEEDDFEDRALLCFLRQAAIT